MNTLISFPTIECSDCVETCPFNKSIITCSTYQLHTMIKNNNSTSITTSFEHESNNTNTINNNNTINTNNNTSNDDNSNGEEIKEQYHTGTIFHLQIENNEFIVLDTISNLKYGIFDMKYNTNYPLLAVCHTNNSISIYRLINNYKKLKLEIEYKFDDKNTMITSIDWNDIKFKNENIQLICSDSIGRIHLLNLTFNELNIELNNELNIKLELIKTNEQQHLAECWTSSFNYFSSNLIYSGGDDFIFKIYDIKNDELIHKSSTKHQAGICCIQHSLDNEFQVFSGSYDDTFKCWDLRFLKNPMVDLNLQGGVWNIKQFNNYITTATMYNGFHLLDYNLFNMNNNSSSSGSNSGSNGDEKAIVEHYVPQDSLLSYGIDFVELDNHLHLITCTFYDGQLRLTSSFN